MLRQSGGVDSREEPLGVDLGLLLVFPAYLLLPLVGRFRRLILPRLPPGLGFGAHALAGGIAGLRIFALQAAGISAAERLPGFCLAIPPEKRVSPLARLPVRALELRLPPPALVVLFQHLLGGAAAGRFRQSVGQALLEILRQPGQGIGRLFRQLVLLEQPHVLRDQLLPDNLQPGQLRGGDFARRRHLVPHPAGELQPFLLQHIQQLLHTGGDFSLLRIGIGLGVQIVEDQPQFLQGAGLGGVIPDAGDPRERRPTVVH